MRREALGRAGISQPPDVYTPQKSQRRGKEAPSSPLSTPSNRVLDASRVLTVVPKNFIRIEKLLRPGWHILNRRGGFDGAIIGSSDCSSLVPRSRARCALPLFLTLRWQDCCSGCTQSGQLTVNYAATAADMLNVITNPATSSNFASPPRSEQHGNFQMFGIFTGGRASNAQYLSSRLPRSRPRVLQAHSGGKLKRALPR